MARPFPTKLIDCESALEMTIIDKGHLGKPARHAASAAGEMIVSSCIALHFLQCNRKQIVLGDALAGRGSSDSEVNAA